MRRQNNYTAAEKLSGPGAPKIRKKSHSAENCRTVPKANSQHPTLSQYIAKNIPYLNPLLTATPKGSSKKMILLVFAQHT